MVGAPVTRKTRREQIDVALRISIVVLTLATAAIHYSLGGVLFFLNALGYTTLAAALVVPGAFADRFRWMPRLALIGFAAATIFGWLLIGARYDIAYLSKAIEVALIALLVVDTYRAHGTPFAMLRQGWGAVSDFRATRLARA